MVLFALGCGANFACGQTILSSTYDISGYWNETWMSYNLAPSLAAASAPALYSGRGGGSQSGAFSLTSADGTPLNLNVASSPYGYETASGAVSAFDLKVSATSANYDYGYPDASTYPSQISISANSTTDFRPTTSQLSLTLTGAASWLYNLAPAMSVGLQDLTQPSTLLGMSNLANVLDSNWVPATYNYTFDVNPSDVYELSLSGSAFNDNLDIPIQGELVVGLASIPEPGAEMAEFGLAACVLIFIRKRLLRQRG